jgi:predicted lipoprotein with Yx(FWY)xxD motif
MKTIRAIKRPHKTVAIRLAPAVIVAGGLLAAAAAPAPASASTTQTVVHTVKVGKYGTILVNARGLALYTYSKDTKNHSTVTGQLLAFWPALVVPASVTPAGTHVTGLGVAMRSNGQHQVTYHGKPLYLFTSDKKAGQVTGQGVAGFAVATVGSSQITSTSNTSTSSARGSGY